MRLLASACLLLALLLALHLAITIYDSRPPQSPAPLLVPPTAEEWKQYLRDLRAIRFTLKDLDGRMRDGDAAHWHADQLQIYMDTLERIRQYELHHGQYELRYADQYKLCHADLGPE
jgi:hypothetical protein